MWNAFRWSRTAVANVAEIVLSLFRPIAECFCRRHTFFEFMSLCWQIEENPMDPGSTRGVRVIADQGKALRLLRGFRPVQWRGLIRTVPCVLLRDSCSGLNCGTGDFDGHDGNSL